MVKNLPAGAGDVRDEEWMGQRYLVSSERLRREKLGMPSTGFQQYGTRRVKEKSHSSTP